MAGEKLQELPRVALIGLDGQRRKPPLMRKCIEPDLPLGHQLFVGNDQDLVQGRLSGDRGEALRRND